MTNTDLPGRRLDLVAPQTDQSDQSDQLKFAVLVAYETAEQDEVDVRHAFVRDIQELGAVRATRLWARKAMKAETTVSVWEPGVELGGGGGDWVAALAVSERVAVQLLKESVHPTRNAVDKALNEVQGRTAAELLDTIASFRKAGVR